MREDLTLNEEQLKELNFLMSQTLSEKDLGKNKPKEYLYLDNGSYIDANLKWAGHSLEWITYPSGYKAQRWEEDFKKIQGDNFTEARPANCCRICSANIKPYKNIYFRCFNEVYGDSWYKAYGFNNNYCENCAQKQEAIEKKQPKAPRFLREYSYHLAGDRYKTRTMEFEGFTIQSNDAWNKNNKR